MLVASLIAVAVAAAILLLAAYLKRLLDRIEHRRGERLGELGNANALPVPASVGDSDEAHHQEHRDSVRRRFSIVRWTLLILLGLLGIGVCIAVWMSPSSAAILSVGAGVISVFIGIAARPFLENFVSGLVITLSGKIHVGDTIYIDGQLGTIEDVTSTHTVVKVWNWQRYILPNSTMLAKEISNCTHRENYLWTHVEFYVSYEQDFDALEGWAIAIVRQSKYFSGKDAPELWVMGMEPQAIKCWLAAWVIGPEAAWFMRIDMRRGLVRAFQEHRMRSHLLRICTEAEPGSPATGPAAATPAAQDESAAP